MKTFLLVMMFAAAAITGSVDAHAQQAWQIEKLDASTLPNEIVPETREKSVNGLPDGRVATAGGNATIRQAWYSKPTGRYGHAVLGDTIEGGSLVVVTNRGVKLKYRLHETEVFEDITPRLADLDGDGKTEVITIQANLLAGAAIAIYQVNNNTLVRAARSKYIGQAFRWLNIAGISNYTGNRTPEIAIVVTPHIGGRLDLYKFHGGRLLRLMSKQGFSNHFIGSRELRLSATYLSQTPNKANLTLPSADRTSMMIMSAQATGWVQKGIIRLPSPIDKAIGVSGSGDKVKFTVGLSDGSVYSVFMQ